MVQAKVLYIAASLAAIYWGASSALAMAEDVTVGRPKNMSVADRMPEGYAPLGVRLGGFVLMPKVDLGVGFNDNIFFIPSNKRGDTTLTIAPSVSATSNWGRHSLNAFVSVNSDSYAKYNEENTVAADARVAGRLDVVSDSNLFAEVEASRNYEGLYSPTTSRSAVRPVKYDALKAKVGFVAQSNRLKFAGKYSYEKLNYFDTQGAGGLVLDQDVRDFTHDELSGRFDYAVSPDTGVFAIYTADKREYRLNKSLRDSHGYDVGLGAMFNLSEFLRGEVQIGYLHQTYKNPLYKPATGSFFGAKIQYYPTQLLTVDISTNRSVEETPEAGASSFLSTVNTVGVNYELLRNFLLSSSLGYTTDKYVGLDRRDQIGSFNLGARYLVSRNVTVKISYNYSKLQSDGIAAFVPYDDNTFKITLGLQY